MKKKIKLPTNIIYPNVISNIMASMTQNQISMKDCKLRIVSFDVQQLKKKNGIPFKNSIDLDYKITKPRDTAFTTVSLVTTVQFEGRGDIPYRIQMRSNIKALISEEQTDMIKQYTYALTKAYLMNDKTLLLLYPRDLYYPLDMFEEYYGDIDVNNDFFHHNNYMIRVQKERGEKTYDSYEFTDDEERRFNRLVEEYNAKN